MELTPPFLFTFGFYIFAMVAIGFVAYRFTKNLGDYILGGRRLGSFVTALSAGASDMSGWLLMGLPGAIFRQGLAQAWIAIGLTLGAYFNWRLVAARLRLFTERIGNALTLPDYFSGRFEDKTGILRIFAAIVILTFFTIYSASGVVAGARLFESIFNVDYSTAIWMGAGATIIYTLVGGFLAVSWTDCVQATLMIFTLIIVPFAVISSGSGAANIVHLVNEAQEGFSSLWSGVSLLGIISAAAWGLGYCGQPHILARFMAAKSPEVIPQARRISMTWMVLCLAGAVAVGYFGRGYFLANPGTSAAADVAANPERVFIVLASLLFSPWIAGIVLSAVLAAIMSTLSCQLLVCSSALTEDLYRSFFRKKASQKELVWIGRTMVLLISLVAIFIGFNPESQVLGLVAYAWAGFAAAFGPVVVISLFWRRTTLAGALSGMLCGAVTVVVWKECFGNTGLYEIIPGFVLACVAIFVVSLLTKVSPGAVKVFDEVDKEFRLRMKGSTK